MLKDLKKGITRDLIINKRNLRPGNLTVLFGYGPTAFRQAVSKREAPKALGNAFLTPTGNGVGPILKNSKFRFSNSVTLNHAGSVPLVIQFTGQNEFINSRAVIETWKYLKIYHPESEKVLSITRIYKGFLNDNGRNWMGFHDGVSSIKTREERQL